ncbi:MAG: Peptidase U62 modulator of DNA gyrase, partial [uncultured bacterium]
MIIEKYIQKDEEISLKIVQTKIDSLKRKNIIRTGCRAYDGKYIGIAGALGGHDEKFLENEARAALSLKVPYEYEPGCDLNLSKNLSCDIFAENELISEVETLLEAVRIAQPDFSFSDAVKLINYEERILNDRGLDLCYRDRILVLSLLFKKKTSVNILDGFVSFKGRKYDRAAFLKHLNAVCGAYNNLIDLPAGERFPVIFSTEDPTPLIKFAQDLHGLRFGTKSSIFSDKSGQKLFSDKFDFYFCLDPAENPGSFFDAEGSVNEGFETPLIKNGVLISPYTDKNTSKTYGLPYTKSASCEYDGIPQPALTA